MQNGRLMKSISDSIKNDTTPSYSKLKSIAPNLVHMIDSASKDEKQARNCN